MDGHSQKIFEVTNRPPEIQSGKTTTQHQYPEMKFIITLDRDSDGMWVAECPSIPGCISQGTTRDDAETNIHEAILGCLEVRAENGMPLTVETRLVEIAVA